MYRNSTYRSSIKLYFVPQNLHTWRHSEDFNVCLTKFT